MNTQLSKTELEALGATLSSAPPKAVVMTKQEKLIKLAHFARWRGRDGGLLDAIEMYWSPPKPFFLFHGLEYYMPDQLFLIGHPESIFQAALAVPEFVAAGYKADLEGVPTLNVAPMVSVGQAARFFELSQDDLHEFSCNCGGEISNSDMADRIASIARRS
jgi:hypothetical protein